MSMRLICLNVGLFLENNELLKEFLLEHRPDIIVMQEVSRATDHLVLQKYITKSCIDSALPSLEYSFFAPMWVIRDFIKKDFHGENVFNIDFGGFLEQGYYYRGRYKILQGRNIFILNEFRYQTEWGNWPDDDSRSVQVIDLAVGESGKPNLRILNYHGIWSRDKLGNEYSLEANKKILSIAKEVDYPVIICGDFNLYPNTTDMEIFNTDFENLVNTYSIKSTRPGTNELARNGRNVVDHILVSKGININSFKVLDSAVSDHLPLVLDFDLVH